jgi:hypothetical protein
MAIVGPFSPKKKNSFGQFAAPLLPFLFLVSKWPKFATKKKKKKKKPHIGDDARRRLHRMVSSASPRSNVLETLVKSPD